MKKKQIVLLLAVCAIGALTACSSSSGSSNRLLTTAKHAICISAYSHLTPTAIPPCSSHRESTSEVVTPRYSLTCTR